MSHFYAELDNGVNKTLTRRGFANHGIDTYLKSWDGEIVVRIYCDGDSQNKFRIFQRPHSGTGVGINEEIASGVIGKQVWNNFNQFPLMVENKDSYLNPENYK